MSNIKDGFVIAALLFITLFVIAGCQTVGDVARVLIPVAKSCVVQIERPPFPDTPVAIQAAPNIEARVNLILAGRLMRDERIDKLEAALSGCQ